jgi:transposase-like protein
MRCSASEKLEIIRTVETSQLPVRRTLDKIGIPKTTFYAWLDRYAAGGFDGLEDRKPRPKRVRNRIPDEIRDRSSSELCRSRNCRRARWRLPSPMPRRPSSPRPACIAS